MLRAQGSCCCAPITGSAVQWLQFGGNCITGTVCTQVVFEPQAGSAPFLEVWEVVSLNPLVYKADLLYHHNMMNEAAWQHTCELWQRCSPEAQASTAPLPVKLAECTCQEEGGLRLGGSRLHSQDGNTVKLTWELDVRPGMESHMFETEIGKVVRFSSPAQSAWIASSRLALNLERYE